MLDRRTLLGGMAGAIAFPPCAHAQQPLPLIGFLNSQSLAGWEPFIAAFHAGLKEGGFVVGRNVAVEYRWGEGSNERLPALAADLVARSVNVLVATGGPDPARAAKAATSTIPVVFIVGPDPVKLGLVDSLARPGANITGFTLFTRELGPKRLELLRDLIRGLKLVAALFNPDNVDSEGQFTELGNAAQALGLKLHRVDARGEGEFDAVFENVAAAKPGALFVASDALFFAKRARVTELAAKHKISAIYESQAFVAAGGLISYGVNFAEVYRQAGLYTARILKGGKPADLPVQQPTKFELVVNQATAAALGLAFPPSIMALADEVIE
jgi:putative tryptophan/tyrosine transport system substrate-binding protein